MASIVVLGAALGGLQTALLLAADGHQVTVLERDPHPPPPDPDVAWSQWHRPGIPQLRLTHLPLARWLQLAETHLPGLAGQMTAAGAVRMNVLAPEPGLRGGLSAADARFATLAARRCLLEYVATRAAETAGVRVERGSRAGTCGAGCTADAASTVPRPTPAHRMSPAWRPARDHGPPILSSTAPDAVRRCPPG